MIGNSVTKTIFKTISRWFQKIHFTNNFRFHFAVPAPSFLLLTSITSHPTGKQLIAIRWLLPVSPPVEESALQQKVDLPLFQVPFQAPLHIIVLPACTCLYLLKGKRKMHWWVILYSNKRRTFSLCFGRILPWPWKINVPMFIFFFFFNSKSCEGVVVLK